MLEFPIQIVVRSKKLNIDDYVDNLKDIAQKQMNSLLQKQTLEYIDYIQKLIEYADIMEKEFYVIVPYDPYRAKNKNFIEKFFEHLKSKDTAVEIQRRHAEFAELKKNLTQRVNVVKSGLENCNLRAEPLNTQQLIELFYKIYNPITSQGEKVENIDEINIIQDKDVIEKEETDKKLRK